jgi:AcrR family transcriptional regulator
MRKPKRRAYESSIRLGGARETRAAIIASARELFLRQGYAGTTMPAIAKAASVALDTVYATAGKKPELFRLLVEAAISGESEAVDPERRDYVLAIRAEPDAAAKLRIYAAAVAVMQPRLAPLFAVLQSAATLDRGLAELWREISQRRASNMRLFAEDLAKTGQMRKDLTTSMIADIIWSMNSSEFYLLLAEQRGWSAETFGQWLADSWIRILLESKPCDHST